MSTLAKAIAAWGTEMPAWVRTLAIACHGASLRKIAARLDVSPAIVSLAINKKRQDLDFIKSRVEQHLMTVQFGCPVLGVISGNRCLEEQAKPFSSVNPQRVQLYKACRGGCVYFKQGAVPPDNPRARDGQSPTASAYKEKKQ